MNPTTKCILCKEEIKKDAKICIHCGAHQNWKRYLNISSVILSLLIAVFTVLGFTYPYLKEKLQPPKTELTATLMGTTEDYLYLFFSNTGNRPGSIKEILYMDYNISKRNKRKGGISPSIIASQFSEFEIIQPEESKIVKIRLTAAPLVFPEHLDHPKLNEYKSVCCLRIKAIAFDGSPTEEIYIWHPCVSHEFKKQWLQEELLVGINSPIDTNVIIKKPPYLDRLIEERLKERPLEDFFEDMKNGDFLESEENSSKPHR